MSNDKVTLKFSRLEMVESVEITVTFGAPERP